MPWIVPLSAHAASKFAETRRCELPSERPTQARGDAAADDAEAFHPCGNECSYARFVFSSHVSRMVASDAIGRFLD
jgi:hypothetical protein